MITMERLNSMENLDIEKLERLCALIEVVDDERSYRMLLDILKLVVEKYAKGVSDE